MRILNNLLTLQLWKYMNKPSDIFKKENILRALKESTEEQQKVFNENFITKLLHKYATWK